VWAHRALRDGELVVLPVVCTVQLLEAPLMGQDLFAWAEARQTPACADCAELKAPIDSGIRYCDGAKVWRWAHDRVSGCSHRSPLQPQREGA